MGIEVIRESDAVVGTTTRSRLSAIAAIIVPFTTLSFYIWFTRSVLTNFTSFDVGALVASTALGTLCLAFTHYRPAWRVFLCLLYAPIVAYFLFWHFVLFLGLAYDNWL